jgi:hypothetical protein
MRPTFPQSYTHLFRSRALAEAFTWRGANQRQRLIVETPKLGSYVLRLFGGQIRPYWRLH